MRHYSIAGLSVASEMALPGVMEGMPGTPDVEIRLEPVPSRLAEPSVSGPNWEIDASGFLLRLPAIGRLLAREGRQLAIEPDPGVEPRDMLAFALGTGLGALLYQRGITVLHASAVARDDQAFAFCGPSGIGKSTLAAALCKAGCRFVSDDVSAIRLNAEGRPLLWPDARQLKLFDAGLAAAGISQGRHGAVRSDIEKYYVDPPGLVASQAVPLRAIYVLARDQRLETPRFERSKGLNAALVLQRNGYRPRLALSLARAGNPVAVTAAILRRVPVFHLTRPDRPKLVPQVVEALHRHWETLAGEVTDVIPA